MNATDITSSVDEASVSLFISLTNTTRETALRCLAGADCDMNRAVNHFFQGQGSSETGQDGAAPSISSKF